MSKEEDEYEEGWEIEFTKDEMIQMVEGEICGVINRWQEESELDALDIVGLLEQMKLQLYYEYYKKNMEDNKNE